MARNGKTDIDHNIAANRIHNDRGRALANISGVDLANSAENLYATNPNTNRSKKALSMPEYLEKNPDKYTEEQKENMMNIHNKASSSYEFKLATAYYTSTKFAKDMSLAAGKVGLRMGIRQSLGFVFAELWFAVKKEFDTLGNHFDLSSLFQSIAKGIQSGFQNAKAKYKDLFEKFKEGAISGALSSLTTTLCNIFFTTAKNIVTIIRQFYVYVVQASKVLFINPDRLSCGEQVRSATKILATGASVISGVLVVEALSKTPINAIPVGGNIIQSFCGAFVTGIMSCSLLYFFDRNETVNKLVSVIDSIHTIDREVEYFHKQAEYFEIYAAELMQIDIDSFKNDIRVFTNFSKEISNVSDEQVLHSILKKSIEEMGIKLPWCGDFDTFMKDKKACLEFS